MATLEGKTAIVTGSSRGIGRAIALRLAQEGASVVVAARTADALDELVLEIVRSGGKAAALALDSGAGCAWAYRSKTNMRLKRQSTTSIRGYLQGMHQLYLADPAVKTWTAAQNRHTRTYFDGLPDRAGIEARLTGLFAKESPGYCWLVSRPGRLFALKNGRLPKPKNNPRPFREWFVSENLRRRNARSRQ